MPHRSIDIPGVMWDDTFVLGWRVEQDRLVFDVEISLHAGHPSYLPPRPGEWACYRRGQLIFNGARDVQGLRSMSDVRPTIDPDGSADYETIHSFAQEDDGTFLISGGFGDVRLRADGFRLAFADAA